MKILLINLNSAGLFHYACSLAEALKKYPEITEVTLITSEFNNTSAINSKNIKSFTIKAPHSLPDFLIWSISSCDHRRLASFIKEEKPDVIHILDSYPIYPRYYSILKKYPIIFTQHDPVPHRGDQFSIITKAINYYLHRISCRIIVHGDALKRELVKSLKTNSSKVAVVPLGYFPNLVPKENATPKTGSILFFGRIVEYKGLDILLKSLSLLVERGVPFSLVIAGPGDLTPYRSLLSRVNNVTIFNEYISDEKVKELFSRAEIVAMPYKEATQSAVAALALAAGKAIVATRVGALEEVLRDGYNSLLTPPNNPKAFAEAMETVLKDSELRHHLALNAKKTAEEKLNWGTIAKQHVEIYREVV